MPIIEGLAYYALSFNVCVNVFFFSHEVNALKTELAKVKLEVDLLKTSSAATTASVTLRADANPAKGSNQSLHSHEKISRSASLASSSGDYVDAPEEL